MTALSLFQVWQSYDRTMYALLSIAEFWSGAESGNAHAEKRFTGSLINLDLTMTGAMPARCVSARPKPLRRALLARQAALLMFCDPLPLQCARLKHLSSGEWQRLLTWLDISGLALYLFDRIVELQLCHWLPSSVFARLEQNLLDNTVRTRGMIAESASIQQDFQEARLSYAVLKGLSLWPNSVSKPELRSQFDMDFLVADTCAANARRILERRGYRLYAVSGRSWEFKLNEKPGIALKDIYRASPSHAVELHIEASNPDCSSPLERAEMRNLCGCRTPVLSPVDLLLGQGLHAYKHVCSEFSRTSHLLEFRRHVLARRDDRVFWNELQTVADGNARASLGIGVVTLLTSRMIGDFAPKELTDWTVRRLPRSARAMGGNVWTPLCVRELSWHQAVSSAPGGA